VLISFDITETALCRMYQYYITCVELFLGNVLLFPDIVELFLGNVLLFPDIVELFLGNVLLFPEIVELFL
jgi:hypothetical protein